MRGRQIDRIFMTSELTMFTGVNILATAVMTHSHIAFAFLGFAIILMGAFSMKALEEESK